MPARLTHVIATGLAAAGLVLAPFAGVAQQEPVPSPEELVADQRYGMLEGPASQSVESVAPAEVDLTSTDLPAPQPSAEVFLRPADGVFEVTGGGFGHGIGMSQYGADGAGQAGLDHAEVLDFYYPGTRLETRTFDDIDIGITVDDDGLLRVLHRSGLRVSAGPAATSYALPTGRDQWRVRATGSSASTCVLEGRSGGTWAEVWPGGMAQACPVTFSSPSESTVDLVLPGESVRVYRGALTAVHRGTPSLATVNTLPMQAYLRSVVHAEMPSWFHPEALQAQAVAARTYAARRAGGTAYYDTCDTTACQAYRGRGARTSSGSITSYEHPHADAAVAATAGQVLTYLFPGGRGLATTMYSSANGGWSTTGGAGHGYLVAREDPYDDVAGNSRHTWTAQLPLSALESRYRIHRVERVQILSRDGHGRWGGRVLEARVEGFTSSGAYTWAYATGTGLMLARPFPAYSTGISSTYYTLSGGTAPAATRIAGDDRFETAAAIAGTWPAGVAVAYVASGRDFPDALAAAARSGVYDAPVLLTEPTSVPSATASALTRLRPARIVVVGGTTAVSSSVMSTLATYATSGGVTRVAGDTRYDTAARMASYYPSGVSRVYLASGRDHPDALSGAALAAQQGAPLLLTEPGGLPDATATQLARLDPEQVVVLGGTSAVSGTTATAAGRYSADGTFTRVAGEDRYETAELVARRLPASTARAYVASGTAYPDALVGAALAGRRAAPLLLTRASEVPAATGRALDRMALRDVTVVGGSSVVSDGVLRSLDGWLE